MEGFFFVFLRFCSNWIRWRSILALPIISCSSPSVGGLGLFLMSVTWGWVLLLTNGRTVCRQGGDCRSTLTLLMRRIPLLVVAG